MFNSPRTLPGIFPILDVPGGCYADVPLGGACTAERLSRSLPIIYSESTRILGHGQTELESNPAYDLGGQRLCRRAFACPLAAIPGIRAAKAIS